MRTAFLLALAVFAGCETAKHEMGYLEACEAVNDLKLKIAEAEKYQREFYDSGKVETDPDKRSYDLALAADAGLAVIEYQVKLKDARTIMDAKRPR